MGLGKKWVVQANRDPDESAKRKSEGISIYANNRWCNPGHIIVKENSYHPNIEHIVVQLYPCYTPNGCSHAIVIV